MMVKIPIVKNEKSTATRAKCLSVGVTSLLQGVTYRPDLYRDSPDYDVSDMKAKILSRGWVNGREVLRNYAWATRMDRSFRDGNFFDAEETDYYKQQGLYELLSWVAERFNWEWSHLPHTKPCTDAYEAVLNAAMETKQQELIEKFGLDLSRNDARQALCKLPWLWYAARQAEADHLQQLDNPTFKSILDTMHKYLLVVCDKTVCANDVCWKCFGNVRGDSL